LKARKICQVPSKQNQEDFGNGFDNSYPVTRPEKSLHILVKNPDSNLHFLVSPEIALHLITG
jgi:hypothetical protein